MIDGRDPERAVIWGMLEAARASKGGALVLRGEPGIGKSALLGDARDRAGDMQVLAARVSSPSRSSRSRRSTSSSDRH